MQAGMLKEPMFKPGERYRLPSGNSVEIVGASLEAFLTCRYLRRGEMRPRGKQNCGEVCLTPQFLAAFGVAI